jgi:hypothetical protein
MHHYLVSYLGEGTDRNPFRPDGSDQPGWAAIDLRPDVTILDGFALLALPIRDDTAARRYLGEDLDEPSVTTRQELDSRLSVTLVATTLRQQIAELLIEERSGSRWKPLRPTLRGVYEILLGGKIYEQPVLRGGTTITESFNQTDSTTIGPDLTWTEISQNSQTVGNEWVTGATATLYEARADSDLASDNHYAQGVTSLVSSADATDSMIGLIVRQRHQDTTRTHYGFRYRSGTSGERRELYRRVSGTLTSLVGPNVDAAYTTGDTLRIEINGSSLSGRIVGVGGTDSVTDTNITGNLRAGVIGQRGTASATIPKLDNFEAGDLTLELTPTVGAAVLAGVAGSPVMGTLLTPAVA